MEYRLNKIDPDIRERIEKSLKTDKIHGNSEKSGIRNVKDDESRQKNNTGHQKKKNAPKKYVTVDSVRFSHDDITCVDAEKSENINEENSKGRILDTRK